MQFVDHSIIVFLLNYLKTYIFLGDFVRRHLLRGQSIQIVKDFHLAHQVAPEMFVTVEQNDQPLLNDVRIRGVLLVILERIYDPVDTFQSQRNEVISYS
jgi:hypothetical protein